MYYIYILKSQKNDRHYIGSTEDLTERLKRHNTGKNKSTKSGIPWKLIYSESFQTKQDAYRREMQIKSYRSGNAFKKLISQNK